MAQQNYLKDFRLLRDSQGAEMAWQFRFGSCRNFDMALAIVKTIAPARREYDPAFIPSAVAGALTAYDLPDLAASLAPRELVIVSPVDGSGQRATAEALDTDLSVVRSAYAARGARDALRIEPLNGERTLEEALAALQR